MTVDGPLPSAGLTEVGQKTMKCIVAYPMMFLTNSSILRFAVGRSIPTHHKIETPLNLARPLRLVSPIQPTRANMKIPVPMAAPSVTSAASSSGILQLA